MTCKCGESAVQTKSPIVVLGTGVVPATIVFGAVPPTSATNPQPSPDWGVFHVPQSRFWWADCYFDSRESTSVLVDCCDDVLSHHIDIFPDGGYADDPACMRCHKIDHKYYMRLCRNCGRIYGSDAGTRCDLIIIIVYSC